MKKLFLAVFVAVMSLLTVTAQNYPDLYLVGQGTNWSKDENYKMKRSGNVYAIYLPGGLSEVYADGSGWKIYSGE